MGDNPNGQDEIVRSRSVHCDRSEVVSWICELKSDDHGGSRALQSLRDHRFSDIFVAFNVKAGKLEGYCGFPAFAIRFEIRGGYQWLVCVGEHLRH